MSNKIIKSMISDNLIDSNFEDELLEFTKANQVEKERAIQSARSRGGGQKEVDKERKKSERKSESESASPWKRVVIVKTNQDGKIRLIPRSDFQANKHELLYGDAPGQAPKPEVTPNVAQEMASQDEFEASKTSNRLLGIVNKKKRAKEQIVRSDHYDYPKDGIEIKDPKSSYADWDHAPESLAQGISLVANSTGSKQVDIQTVSQFFGQSQTLMDASIRAYQQLGEKLKGQFSVTAVDQAYPVTKEYKKLLGDEARPITDLIVQDQSGTVYKVSIISDETKIITDEEADVLFNMAMTDLSEQLQSDEKITKKLQKLKEKVSNYISSFNTENNIKKKYIYTTGDNFKREIISDLEYILESNDALEMALMSEVLTGIRLFGEESPASANALMSTSRDGTNLRFVPLQETSLKRLAGEVLLKIKLVQAAPEVPFDGMYELLVTSNSSQTNMPMQPTASTPNADQQTPKGMQAYPQMNEFFELLEDRSDAKLYFENVLSEQPSLLLGFMSLLGLTAYSIIVRNIDLDSIGSISNGDYTKIGVGDRTFYVDIEKDIEYYDSDALRLGEERDYDREYDNYQGTDEQKKRRACRNAARRIAEKNGNAHNGDGKDVHHRDHNPCNNSSNNTNVINKSKNRGDNKDPIKEEHGAGDEGTDELLMKYIFDTPYMNIPDHLLKRKKRKSRK